MSVGTELLLGPERYESDRLTESHSGTPLVHGACGQGGLGQPGRECLSELQTADGAPIDLGQRQTLSGLGHGV